MGSLQNRLGDDTRTLFRHADQLERLSDDAVVTRICHKMDSMAKHLNLDPYKGAGQCQWLSRVSKTEITPIHLLCPISCECDMIGCEPRALHLGVRGRDIPHATLCLGTEIHHDVAVLSAKCFACQVMQSIYVNLAIFLLYDHSRVIIQIMKLSLILNILGCGQEPISTLPSISRLDNLHMLTVSSHGQS